MDDLKYGKRIARLRTVREEYRQKMNAYGHSAARALEEEDWLKASVQSTEAARMETVFLALNRVMEIFEAT
jgi:hypothetical protein